MKLKLQKTAAIVCGLALMSVTACSSDSEGNTAKDKPTAEPTVKVDPTDDPTVDPVETPNGEPSGKMIPLTDKEKKTQDEAGYYFMGLEGITEDEERVMTKAFNAAESDQDQTEVFKKLGEIDAGDPKHLKKFYRSYPKYVKVLKDQNVPAEVEDRMLESIAELYTAAYEREQ